MSLLPSPIYLTTQRTAATGAPIPQTTTPTGAARRDGGFSWVLGFAEALHQSEEPERRSQAKQAQAHAAAMTATPVRPPSTSITLPWTNAASSLARNATTAATSDAWTRAVSIRSS